MFKNHYFVVIHACYVILRWFNNFLKNVSWGALLCLSMKEKGRAIETNPFPQIVHQEAMVKKTYLLCSLFVRRHRSCVIGFCSGSCHMNVNFFRRSLWGSCWIQKNPYSKIRSTNNCETISLIYIIREVKIWPLLI